MLINLEQEQLTALIEHLGALVDRYEAEATYLGKLSDESEQAHVLALKRLAMVQEAQSLWEKMIQA